MKVIISYHSVDPYLLIKDLGRIAISDLYLQDEWVFIKQTNLLYTLDSLETGFEYVELDDGLVEKVITVAKEKAVLGNNHKPQKLEETVQELKEALTASFK